MNKPILFSAIFLCVLLSANSFGQQQPQPDGGKAACWMDVQDAAFAINPTAKKLGGSATAMLGLSESDELNVVLRQSDAAGEHVLLQQTHKGIPVEGAQVRLHQTNGGETRLGGSFVKGVGPGVSPAISEQLALQLALNHVNASQYAWQSAHYENALKSSTGNADATFLPQGQLVIASPGFYKGLPESADAYRLAYKFDIYAVEPQQRSTVYVDAVNGTILAQLAQMCSLDVGCTGNTNHACSNPVNITADFDGTNYRLSETARGNGIETYSAGNQWGYPLTYLQNPDAHWANDPTSIDVHWGGEQVYDYFSQEFDRDSYDDNGSKIMSWVHYGQNFNNAFWNGQWMTVGDGDGITYAPLSSLDIIAHELTHGITDHSADLVYAYESGALNESFSDIFAVMVDYYANGQCADWVIGDQVVVAAGKNGLRSLINPQDPNMLTPGPSNYKGNLWHSNASDFGGVHYNCGVQNHWFYLLCEGGAGTNDFGDAYSLGGIGMEAAAAIAYRNLTVYLTSTAQFVDARNGSLLAARDLYGAGSPQETAVSDAWCAVGICPDDSKNITVTALNASEELDAGSQTQLTWSHTGIIGQVKIEYSVNGGASWQIIAANAPNNGSYSWTVPNTATSLAKIKVTAADDPNVSALNQQHFSIVACGAIAGFVKSATHICVGETLNFTNTSANAANYQWQIDAVTQSNGIDFSHTFNEAGTYLMRLLADNGGSCSDVYDEFVVVEPLPDAEFGSFFDGQLLYFGDLGGAEGMEHLWDFGDGASSTEAQASHSYANSGNYSVCLTLSDPGGCGSDQYCRNVNYAGSQPCPDAAFELAQTGVCENDPGINLSALVSQTITKTITVSGSDGATSGQSEGAASIKLPNLPCSAEIVSITLNHAYDGGLTPSLSNWSVTAPDGSVLASGTNVGGSTGSLVINDFDWTDHNGVAHIGSAPRTKGTWKFETSSQSFPWTSELTLEITYVSGSFSGPGVGYAGDGQYSFNPSGLSVQSPLALQYTTGCDDCADVHTEYVYVGSAGDCSYAIPAVCRETWENYTNGSRIQSLATTGNQVWAGTTGGLVHIDLDAGETEVFTSAEGLPSNSVVAIAIDAAGNKWLGTPQGLVKFDGYGFEVFRTGNSGLPGNSVKALAVGNAGEIWVGTAGNGLAKFNAAGTWTVYSTSGSGGLPNDQVNALAYDALGGTLWIGTEGGVASLNGNLWNVYDAGNSGLTNDDITAITVDSNGAVWAGTNGGGVFKFLLNDWLPQNAQLPDLVVNDLMVDELYNLWAATPSGLAMYGGSQWVTYDQGNSDLPDDGVEAIAVLGLDKWVGTQNGLADFDGLTWTQHATSTTGYAGDLVNDIAVDNNNVKWFAQVSAQGGLMRVDNSSTPVSMSFYSAIPGGLPSNTVHQVAVSPVGNEKWVATNNGLARFDETQPPAAQWTTYNTGNSDLTNNYVTAVAADASGGVWLRTNDFKLHHFDGVSAWQSRNIPNLGLPDFRLRTLALESETAVWVAVNGKAARLNASTGNWVTYDAATSGIPYNDITRICPDGGGGMWFGTQNHGVIHYAGGVFSNFNALNSGLPDNRVNDLKVDASGKLWVATQSGGVAKYDGTDWYVFDAVDDGLANNSISVINVDLDGDKWMASNVSDGSALSRFRSNEAVAAFSAGQTEVCAGEMVAFSNTSVGALQYEWRVNDVAVGSTEDFERVFEAPGEYAVTLVAADSYCSSAFRQTIVVHPDAASLDLGGDYTACSYNAVVSLGEELPGFESYQWSYNGSPGGTAKVLSGSQSGVYSITVTDFCGATASDEISVDLDSDCVWPGDFNYDNVVNNKDLLAFGLAFGETGLQRSGASYSWQGQAANDWGAVQENGVNYKHIDANGDGVIDLSDPSAIEVNYDLQHANGPPPVANTLSPISLNPVLMNSVALSVNNNIMVALEIDNEAAEEVTAYGLAFDVQYSTPIPGTFVGDVELDMTGSWLGVEGDDLVSIARHKPAENKVEVAFTRIDRQNSTGSGVCGILIMPIEDLPTIDELELLFSVSNVTMITSNGAAIPVGASSANFSLAVSPPSKVAAKLVLEGAYDAGIGLMRTDLHDNGLLPLLQPYSQMPWQYGGEEGFASMDDLPENMVDWVLLEMRDNTNGHNVVESRAGVLLGDGTVADLNWLSNPVGSPSVNFYSLQQGGDYRLVVRHRNHVDVMSAAVLNIPPSLEVSCDFTAAEAQAEGAGQLTGVAANVYALRAGDLNGDGLVTVQDYNLFKTQMSQMNAYFAGDCELNASVTVSDYNLYLRNASHVGVPAVRY